MATWWSTGSTTRYRAIATSGYSAKMRTLGWPYPFSGGDWSDIESKYAALASEHADFEYMLAIVRSIRQSGVPNSLAGMTSMHDLIVAAVPLQSPPIETIVVRAPGSVYPPSSGYVLIEHLAVSGKNDRIERPVEAATSLFWRFVIEKFGVRPVVIN